MQDEKHHQLKYEIQVTERYQGSPIPAPAITFNGGSKEGMVGADDLVSAAKNGDLPQVQALLTGGGDVNVRSDGGMTALMHASQYNHVEVVQALLASGADVNAKTSYGNSALTFACAHGFLEIVQTLLANGADVNDPREPPLQAAAGNGHLEVVRALLAKSAEVNAKDSVGTRSRYDSG
jgi:ankyrin repeat protein